MIVTKATIIVRLPEFARFRGEEPESLEASLPAYSRSLKNGG
jgi:hypothetical protein